MKYANILRFMMVTALAFWTSPLCAQTININPKELFGDEYYDMPESFGSAISVPHPKCENFSSFLGQTPKTIQFFIYKRDRSDNIQISSKIEGNTNIFEIKAGKCRYEFHITRTKTINKENISFTPETKINLNDILEYTVSTSFPDTDVDCGKFSAGMFGDNDRISFVTFPENSDAGVNAYTEKPDKIIELTKNQCKTSIVLSTYVLIDGKWIHVAPF